jgi:ketosteroid isomerase-like protein
VGRDDVELVREAFELLDSDRYEEVLPLVAEDFEMVTTSEVASEPDTYRGRAGVRRWFESFLEAMDSVQVEARRLHSAGRGLAIAEFVIRARGQRSGIEAEQAAIALATVADGMLLRLEFFTSLDQARAAARARSS